MPPLNQIRGLLFFMHFTPAGSVNSGIGCVPEYIVNLLVVTKIRPVFRPIGIGSSKLTRKLNLRSFGYRSFVYIVLIFTFPAGYMIFCHTGRKPVIQAGNACKILPYHRYSVHISRLPGQGMEIH